MGVRVPPFAPENKENMKYDIEQISSTKRAIEITIPEEDAEDEFMNQANTLKEEVDVPGFRKGKAPLKMIISKYRDTIEQRMLAGLVPETVKKVMEEIDAEPIGEPDITHLDYERNQPISLKAEFEVSPDIELGDYTEIQLTKESERVSSEEVDEVIEKFRENSAVLSPVENGEAGEGNTVIFDMESTVGGSDRTFSNENISVDLSNTELPADFTDEILGMEVEQEKTFTVEYPKDYFNTDLAGETVTHTVKLNSIKEKQLPELDDEFAKSIDVEGETLEEVRETIFDNLREQKKQQSEDQLKEDLMDKLRRMHNFDVPDSYVENMKDAQIRNVSQSMAAQRGVTPDQMDVDWEKMREEGHEDAVKGVRSSMIIEKIAREENIEVSQEDIDEKIREIARKQDESFSRLKNKMEESDTNEKIRSSVLHEKTLEFILEKVQITKTKE